MYLSLSLPFSLSFCLSGHVFSSLQSNVSKVTSLTDRSLKVFSSCTFLCLCPCLFVRQVMFSHHLKQISQRSHVSRISVCSKIKMSVTERVTESPIELSSNCVWTRDSLKKN